jgi:hypothetical protein
MRTLLLALCLTLATLTAARADETDLAQLASGEFYGSLLGVGLLLPLAREEGTSGALRAGDALVVTVLATQAIKALGLEDRPANGPGAGKSDRFPSGHASTAFAIATVQAKLHPDEAAYWYGAAGLVAASRVKGEHLELDLVVRVKGRDHRSRGRPLGGRIKPTCDRAREVTQWAVADFLVAAPAATKGHAALRLAAVILAAVVVGLPAVVIAAIVVARLIVGERRARDRGLNENQGEQPERDETYAAQNVPHTLPPQTW